jgi:hypothetical protein
MPPSNDISGPAGVFVMLDLIRGLPLPDYIPRGMMLDLSRGYPITDHIRCGPVYGYVMSPEEGRRLHYINWKNKARTRGAWDRTKPHVFVVVDRTLAGDKINAIYSRETWIRVTGWKT